MILLVMIGSMIMGFTFGFLAKAEQDGEKFPHGTLLKVFLFGLGLTMVGAAFS